MYWLDTEIRAATGGKRSLDDVVRMLARDGSPLTTAGLLRAVNRSAAGYATSSRRAARAAW